MATEYTIVTGTPKTLEASGASAANNTIVQADDANYGIVADGASFPDAKFVLSFAFGTAPTENSAIGLYARPLNINSTNDAEVPETTRPTVAIGSFICNNVTTTQYAELIAEDVPWEAAYYLHNNATGQTLSAGWSLVVTPFSGKPAA